ncbi:filamin-A-like [Maylandia zebra]|uniref:filamin-A-like n=1 Tax=Maylandia zebra TaxID=106582 RepID=UPI00403CA4D4
MGERTGGGETQGGRQSDCQDGEVNSVDVQVKDNSNSTYTCTPRKPVKHTVMVSWGDANIPESPFRMNIRAGCHPNKVKVSDPGVAKTGLKAFQPTYFTEGPEEPCLLKMLRNAHIGISFVPREIGEHLVNIKKNARHVPSSPIAVMIKQSGIGDSLRNKLDELQGNVRFQKDFRDSCVMAFSETWLTELDQDADFSIDGFGAPFRRDRDARDGEVNSVDVQVKDNSNSTYTCTPRKPVKHTVMVSWGDANIPESPFRMNIRAGCHPNKVKVSDPGVAKTGLKAFQPTYFTEGPEEPCLLKMLRNAHIGISFVPREIGEHLVNIKKNARHVPSSPIAVMIKQSGIGDDGEVNSVDVQVKDNSNSTYTCTPRKPVKHTVMVSWGDANIPESPFRMNIRAGCHPNKVKVSDPGVAKTGLKAFQPTYFTEGPEEPCLLKMLRNAHIGISFVPREIGEHLVNIKKNARHVPSSPIAVMIKQSGIGDVKAYGPGLQSSGLAVGKPSELTVDAKQGGKAPLKIIAQDGEVNSVDVQVKDNSNSTYTCTPRKPVKHTVMVSWGDANIPESPFRMNIRAGCHPNKVKVSDPGVAKTGLKAFQPTYFTEGPEEPCLLKMLRNAHIGISFVPREIGEHLVNIKKNARHVPSSPIAVMIKQSGIGDVKAYGPGLQSSGLAVGKPSELTVDAKQGGKAPLKIIAQDGEVNSVDVQVKDNSNSTYTCTPRKPVKHTVMVSWGDANIPESPFRMNIRAGCHPNKVKVSDPGVAKTGLKAFQPTYFTEGPEEPCLLKMLRNAHIGISFVPREIGEHLVNIKKNARHVPSSPIAVMIKQSGIGDVKAYGPGLQSSGLAVGKPSELTVDAKQGGKAPLKIIAQDGEVNSVDVQVKDNSNSTYTCTPRKPVKHTVMVSWGDANIRESPFRMNIRAGCHPNKVKVSDPGVAKTGLKAFQPTYFTEGPEEPCLLKMLRNAHIGISFVPREIGEHLVNIKKNARHVPSSPIAVMIKQSGIGDVKAYGPGLQSSGLAVGKPSELTVDAKQGGKAPLKIIAQDGEVNSVDVQVKDNSNSTYTCTPRKPVKHTVMVSWGDANIPESPFRMNIRAGCHPNKVKVSDPGVAKTGLKAFQPTYFTEGPEEPCLLKMLRNAHIGISFVPREIGEHLVNIKKNARHVPSSPIAVMIKQSGIGDVKAYGPGLQSSGLAVGKPSELTVDAKQGGKAPLKIIAQDGEVNSVDVQVKDNSNSTYTCTPRKPVKHTVMVSWGDANIPESPFRMNIRAGCHPNKVKVSDPGVAKTGLKAFQPTYFTEGPEEPCLLKMLRNAHIGISFVPREIGEHLVNIKKNARHVPSSPIAVMIKQSGIGDVKAYGPGLQSSGLAVGKPSELTVDAKQGGKAPLKIIAQDGEVNSVDVQVKDNSNSTYTCTPRKPVKHTVMVSWGDANIPESPFRMNIRAGCHPNKVKVSDPGVAKTGLKAFQPTYFTEGPEEPCLLKMLRNAHIGISFVPREIGEHLVNIKKNARHVPSSPIAVMIKQSGIGDVCVCVDRG